MKGPKKVKQTASERAFENMSNAAWNDYVKTFRPAEAALAKNATLTAGERAGIKGAVSADTAEAFKGLTRDTISSSGQAGADVSSGKTKLSLAQDAQTAGATRGIGQSIAETGAEIDESEQRVGIVATGRGFANNAIANSARGAQRATRLAIASSNAKFERNRALIEGAATIAGAATAKGIEGYKKSKRNKFADSLLIDTSGFSKKHSGSFFGTTKPAFGSAF